MPSQKNINQLKDLKQKTKQSKNIVLTDYSGLEVEKFNDLRKQVKEAGGELKVAKNTLIKLALKDFEFDLEGQTAVLFCYDDEITPLKKLYQFLEENELPKIKIGFLDEQLFDKEKVIEMAQLPGMEELKGKLVNIINAPRAGLVYVLKAKIVELVRLLKKLETKSE